jgi:signal transduction histidine kinase
MLRRQRTFRDRLVMMIAPPILVAAVLASGLALFVESDDGRPLGLSALAATLVAGLWSTGVAWLTLRRIDRVADATEALAEAQAEVARGERSLDELPTVDGGRNGDQIARMAVAATRVAGSATELAESQRQSIRKGLATMVINLARRNQSLLDRQVEYLDKLEQSEEDPDRLGELFRVDHLATRMRRNAESLLVLAGADPGRRKGSPVSVSDILRVAIGEVEDYQHIELGRIEDGQVPAGPAVDLAHLTAELMENATQFSPPSAPVDVTAATDHQAGTYVISIRDRGMGLGDRLDTANQTLADPPELGLGMGRSLGFMVVGRLAQRLGATVELRGNEGGGTIAAVRMPLSLLNGEGPPHGGQPPIPPPPAQASAPSTPQPGVEVTPAPGPEQRKPTSTTLEKLLGIGGGGADTEPTPAHRPAAPVPETALPVEPSPGPAPGAPTDGLPPLSQPGGRAGTGQSPPPPPPPPPSQQTPPPASAPIPPDGPVDWQSTSPFGGSDEAAWSPPPVTPGPPAQPAALAEALPTGEAFEQGVQSLLGHPAGQPPTPPGPYDGPDRGLQRRERGASNVPIGQGRPVAASKRSPEEVRAMLSRYRQGLKGGHDGGGAGATDNRSDDRADDRDR